MLIEHEGKTPTVHPGARIAPTAVLCGDVTVGEGTSVGFGVVLTAESGPIVVGAHCVVMENAVLRGVARQPLSLGDRVLVGPHAHLIGCTVEDEVFLATGCSVFNGAVVGRGAEVRINGIVHLRTRLAPGATVPLGWIAVGDPAEILPPHEHERIWAVQKPLNFPKTVFGLDRPPEGETIMTAMMPRYAGSLVRRHADDRTLDEPAAR
jgi:carbonic anhydrase/acetyltransferase-like protein (isoleucine patch superfamily)